MKILLVDARPEERFAEILRECEKRKIEVEVETGSIPAKYAINTDKERKIDGIIINVDLPIYAYEPDLVEEGEGEKVIQMVHNEKLQIPILVFSNKTLETNYGYVYMQMKSWQAESFKFFNFLHELESRARKKRLK